ncbi:MAG: zinc ribbon domain-containing protein [Burkholderiaceae bacterium]
MPIYAYRCEACGFAKDVLQKVSDPQLTVCLSCGEPAFKKQLTAAGFKLKGTGWYATDFRNGAANGSPAVAAEAGEGGDAKSTDVDKSGKVANTDKGSDKNTNSPPPGTGGGTGSASGGTMTTPVAKPGATPSSTS